VPVLALGGYGSQTYVDNVFADVQANGRPAVLLYAGDHDPSGEDIDRDFTTRTNCWTAVRRVALTSTSAVSGQDASARRVPLLKLLRFPAVRERTGLSRSTIWRLERRGEFPKHHRISPNVVAWVEDDVAHWIQLRTNSVAS
jgi:predicted DNA-binding transcriptional regulator AlpA